MPTPSPQPKQRTYKRKRKKKHEVERRPLCPDCGDAMVEVYQTPTKSADNGRYICRRAIGAATNLGHGNYTFPEGDKHRQTKLYNDREVAKLKWVDFDPDDFGRG